jgi:hypothetical protein
MPSFKPKLAAAAVAALLVSIFALPASAAMAAPRTSAQVHQEHRASAIKVSPESASNCNPTPLKTVTECTTVLGGGLKITQITGIAINNTGSNITDVHIQIYGPHGTIQNCPAQTLLGDDTIGCTWKNPSPNANETAGDYCSTAWEFIGAGYYVRLSSECIGVHA